MLPQQLGKLKLPPDDTRYCTMLHTLPHLLSPHSAVLRVHSPGPDSNRIPAAMAWHQQGETSPSVAPASSPFTHLHEGFLALSNSMQRGKGGCKGIPLSSTMHWGGLFRDQTALAEDGFIKGKRLIIYLTLLKTAGCSTSSAYL